MMRGYQRHASTVRVGCQFLTRTPSVARPYSTDKTVDKPIVDKPRYMATAAAAAAKIEPVAEQTPKVQAKAKPSPDVYVPDVQAVDGCQAAAHVAYAFSDTAFIYPISPSTTMGEYCDAWANKGRKNIFGQVVDVKTMQSEAGAAGALHGSLATGGFSTTFTASQGLLLMIPNMYLIAGELLPTVFHVSARALARQALSIFCDHSDVMAVRQTGFALLSSHSVQEVADFAVIAHISTLKSRVPFLHFFDGYRTSSEISKIDIVKYDQMAKLLPKDAVLAVRKSALNPNHPVMKGLGQGPSIYMQASLAAKPYFDATPAVVEQAMIDYGKLTGRHYKLHNYVGHPEAERVIVIMGSGAQTCEEVVRYLNNKGEKTGVLKVHLFRPWSIKHFMEALPKTATHIAVMDRTKEDGCSGLPLYQDVVTSLQESGEHRTVVNGIYGLASKEFSPAMVLAIYKNLAQSKPKNHFVVGVKDDVTHTSLDFGEEISMSPPGTTECMFWGVGGDGMVGANKTAIKLLADNTNKFVQGYFSFSSHKGGGLTVSHLRFGDHPIQSQYQCKNADFVACAHLSYPQKYKLLKPAKVGATFVLNSPWNTLEEMNEQIPDSFKRDVVAKKIRFYNIDAGKIAEQNGMRSRINVVMQAVFFHLANVLPASNSMELLKDSIVKAYGKKGPQIVAQNHACIDAATSALVEIKYPADWGKADAVPEEAGIRNFGGVGADPKEERVVWAEKFTSRLAKGTSNELPVSAFVAGGTAPTGTSMFEKRGIASHVPVWKNNCSQCNYCAMICPHAVIRPFLLSKDESSSAPQTFQNYPATGGAELSGLQYSIQVSSLDCTGCEACVHACPDDALEMRPIAEVNTFAVPNWKFAMTIPDRGELVNKYSVKGSQFQQPLLEFSGACGGCGETPYVKLATQLFGDRMIIANASGCSSVWGGSFGTHPYSVNAKGKGPAWGRSLFEDNAEYGLGMFITTAKRRERLKMTVEKAIESKQGSKALQKLLEDWVKNYRNAENCTKLANVLIPMLEKEKDVPVISDINDDNDLLVPPSQWIIGGDGWAYDIGFGGLDHVLASSANVKILVLDTEMYSNTGGQVSKATPTSAVVKYASQGKIANKKNLAEMAMLYGNVYVASVCLGANMNQCVQAFKEAESYDGPSLIIAYSPCIDWGLKGGMTHLYDEMRQAVDSGYWPLFRFDPRNRDVSGVSPFVLDSKKIRSDLEKFLEHHNRFASLERTNKATHTDLSTRLAMQIQKRMGKLQRMAMDDSELLDALKKAMGEQTNGLRVMLMYGSETGNCEDLARNVAYDLKRRGVRITLTAMNDVEIDDLAEQSLVLCLIATCGQGEFPANSKTLWAKLADKGVAADKLQNVNFAVFGLGDSHYAYFNEAARLVDERLEQLGAKRMMPRGDGNDQDPEKYDTAWQEFFPALCQVLQAPEPPRELPPASHQVSVIPEAVAKEKELASDFQLYTPFGSKIVPLVKTVLLTPEKYDRDIRHFEFNLKGVADMAYSPGDSLGVWAHNDPQKVDRFLDKMGLKGSDFLAVADPNNSRRIPYPGSMTVRQCFTQVLDIFGRPKRRFYDALSMMCTNPDEAKRLNHYLSKDGKAEFQQFMKETPSYAELLEAFPSAMFPLEYIFDFVPEIKPRLYSIASSAAYVGPEQLHLMIVANDWKTPKGAYKHGFATRFLRYDCNHTRTGEGGAHYMPAKINGSAVTVPKDQRVPFIMVGLGTGLAPFRAFVQDRVAAKKAGKETGPMALYYGARSSRDEWCYGEEFTAHAKEIDLHINCAWSRDQEKKIYVNDRIKEDAKLVYDLIVNKNGNYYYCGTSGSAVDNARQELINCIETVGGKSKEYANNYVKEMQLKGRYNVESW